MVHQWKGNDVKPEDKPFAFRFVCKEFEIEFQGDQRYVERLLNRYENKVMVKFRELVPQSQPAEHREPETARPQPPVPHPAPIPAAPGAAPQPGGEKKPRHRRGRGRRGRGGRRDNPDNSAPRNEPDAAARNRRPLLPGEGSSPPPAGDAFSETEPRPEEFDRPVYTHPPLGDYRPAAAEFPSRRRAPRVDIGALKALLEEKRPRTHHDRIMLMGYHLENAAGASDFIAEELMACYESAKENPPANLAQVLSHATRSGFMVRHDQGRIQRFKLSARGRRYVEDGLKLL